MGRAILLLCKQELDSSMKRHDSEQRGFGLGSPLPQPISAIAVESTFPRTKLNNWQAERAIGFPPRSVIFRECGTGLFHK